jgi:kynurenine formamidase
MNIIDLSHTINNTITVFSNREKPDIQISNTHEKDGYAQKRLTLYSHNSTHVDAPFHIIPGAPTLDEMSIESFFGKGILADCRKIGKKIEVADLAKYSKELQSADFLLLYTGWYKKWKTPEYKFDFPVLSTEAAEWLMQFNLKGIGLDTISIDETESTELPVHNIVLGKGLIIIENLTNLEELEGKNFNFSCLPLKIEEADGSPVRAVGIIEEEIAHES